jgi:hypothetical protein
MIDQGAMHRALNERALLKLAALHIRHQPPHILDELIPRIVGRHFDLSSEIQTIRAIPFIPVRGSSQRCLPKDVVDLESPLCPLFEGEDGKFPDASFAPSVFSVLRLYKFFQSSITRELLEERINYIANRKDAAKARLLFALLNESWSEDLIGVIDRSLEWIPAPNDVFFYSASSCRDRSYEHLTDLVLPMVDLKVKSDGLRRELGWEKDIPIHIVLSQLQLTLKLTRDPSRPERLMKLIKYLATLVFENRCPPDVVGDLRNMLDGIEWVPVSRTEVLAARHVLMSDIKLEAPFKKPPGSLLAERKYVQFLELMGCATRSVLFA